MHDRKRKIIWQADVFPLFSPVMEDGRVVRPPVGFILDPARPFIHVSRIFPAGKAPAECMIASVDEALRGAAAPAEIHVRDAALGAALSARSGVFRVRVLPVLRELALVRADVESHIAIELCGWLGGAQA